MRHVGVSRRGLDGQHIFRWLLQPVEQPRRCWGSNVFPHTEGARKQQTQIIALAAGRA